MINGVRKKIRLGDVLIQEGKITQEQLDTALKEQKSRVSCLVTLLWIWAMYRRMT